MTRHAEKTTTDEQHQYFITQILKVADVDFIYLSLGIPDAQVITILVDRDYSRIPMDLLTDVEGVLKKFPDLNFRVYTLRYARVELNKGNLYFIRNCFLGTLLYKKDTTQAGLVTEEIDPRELLEQAEVSFESEIERITAFCKAISFYRKRRYFAPAAFLLHQKIELLYRCMETFAMGKPLICHKVTNHLNYAHPFVHGAGRLFSQTKRKEEKLLEILDQAYSGSRYDNSFQVTKREIKALVEKAEIMEHQVQEIFEFRLADCYNRLRGDEENYQDKNVVEEEGQRYILPKLGFRTKDFIEFGILN